MLQSRGMIINDIPYATSHLLNISYYRLSAYMLPFQSAANDPNHTYKANVHFEDVMDLYVFDRELRLLVFDAIERIEVSFRTQLIYQMALKYGSHWHEDPKHFSSSSTYHELQKHINEHKGKSNREVFMDHYWNKYTNPVNPPSWMSLEIITMGTVSFIFKGLSKDDKKDLAAFYKLHPKVLESWVHALAYVRNICAHHARLWNRDFGVQPLLIQKPRLPWIDLTFNNNRRSYYFLCLLQYLLTTINPGGHLKQRIKELLANHPAVPKQYMGFQKDWDAQPLWL